MNQGQLYGGGRRRSTIAMRKLQVRLKRCWPHARSPNPPPDLRGLATQRQSWHRDVRRIDVRHMALDGQVVVQVLDGFVARGRRSALADPPVPDLRRYDGDLEITRIPSSRTASRLHDDSLKAEPLPVPTRNQPPLVVTRRPRRRATYYRHVAAEGSYRPRYIITRLDVTGEAERPTHGAASKMEYGPTRDTSIALTTGLRMSVASSEEGQ